jgi:hypothetical protein
VLGFFKLQNIYIQVHLDGSACPWYKAQWKFTNLLFRVPHYQLNKFGQATTKIFGALFFPAVVLKQASKPKGCRYQKCSPLALSTMMLPDLCMQQPKYERHRHKYSEKLITIDSSSRLLPWQAHVIFRPAILFLTVTPIPCQSLRRDWQIIKGTLITLAMLLNHGDRRRVMPSYGRQKKYR